MKEKCPKCKKNTYVVSVFGSICSNEDCFYEPYHLIDHYHCWDQEQPPSCGIKGEHKICCLCAVTHEGPPYKGEPSRTNAIVDSVQDLVPSSAVVSHGPIIPHEAAPAQAVTASHVSKRQPAEADTGSIPKQ